MLKNNEEQMVFHLHSLVLCLIIRRERVTRGEESRSETAEL